MPQQFQVVLSREAEANIQAAYSWIAEANPDAAVNWYEGLLEAMQGLSRLPTRCPIAPESRLGFTDREMRQLLYGGNFWKYRILFTIAGDKVLVTHIRHGARLYPGQQEPGDEESDT